MHPPISEADLSILFAEAEAAAARLWRRLGLPSADLDDLRQDLLLDLIRRLPAYDARRGGIGAFAGMVLRHRSVRIAVRVARERRASNGGLLSLDAPGTDGRNLADGLSEEDGLAAWHGQTTGSDAIARSRSIVCINCAVGFRTCRGRTDRETRMFHMLTCFDLKPGIEFGTFRTAYMEFVEHMRGIGLVEGTGQIGARQSDTRMDSDGERHHQYFVIMSFRDRAQVDAAYAKLVPHEEPEESAHRAVYSKVKNQIFICWEDIE